MKKSLIIAALFLFIGLEKTAAQVHSITINNNSACSAQLNFARAIDDTHNGCAGMYNFITAMPITIPATTTGVYYADVSAVNNSISCPNSLAPGWFNSICASATTVSDWAVIQVIIASQYFFVYNPNGVASCMSSPPATVDVHSTGCSSGTGLTRVRFTNDLVGNSIIDIDDL